MPLPTLLPNRRVCWPALRVSALCALFQAIADGQQLSHPLTANPVLRPISEPHLCSARPYGPQAAAEPPYEGMYGAALSLPWRQRIRCASLS